MSGDLSAEAERAFAYRLEDAADQILRHANAKERFVLDGQATTLAIEGRHRLSLSG